MIRAALIYALLSGAALAGPDTSLRPPALAGGAALTPQGSIATPPRNAGAKSAIAATGGIASSLRPSLRSRKAEQAAKAKRRLLAKGAVCGDISIQGKAIGRVQPKLKGCGVSDAVQIQSVSGVRLSQAAVMDCKTAKALKTWIDQSAKPAFAGQGGLRGLRVAAHYACRTRNNQPGGKISEHGRGRAIDISGFQMHSGAEVSVLKGWNAPASRKAMRRVHKGACGPFGTVLGPKANRFHLDHFHFDTARYRKGTYCR
ncbi:extensin family protein [Sulfitobacter pontiacus]|jgi:hypothetical protein|uniref:extensin-like domain-containing protein n=1 Tax=Sulfitobacter pontiacus TaxID=60137 RepID=UPI00045320D7|nr:extensin family protein [Sulfitobacter pontiacus]KAJ29935.1 hypothetical protein PM01_11675 [Sulfitobacter pontiacus 3SOLIMAR09]